ncbi:UNVERIFIED_CONTAM: ma3 domain-containing translation regulatory factor 4 [Sesamum calycinum]|uniref:Ma3 domain-containing translation regulatory factor 4 n=1 Tax=Sesamum calycinum TaxID=2727403 RepID=A0AAW2IVL1_9LAMI
MENKNERQWRLLRQCCDMQLITMNQMTKGFNRVAESLDDLALDVPMLRNSTRTMSNEPRLKDGWTRLLIKHEHEINNCNSSVEIESPAALPCLDPTELISFYCTPSPAAPLCSGPKVLTSCLPEDKYDSGGSSLFGPEGTNLLLLPEDKYDSGAPLFGPEGTNLLLLPEDKYDSGGSSLFGPEGTNLLLLPDDKYDSGGSSLFGPEGTNSLYYRTSTTPYGMGFLEAPVVRPRGN